jgi:hypothetical protein
MWGGGNSHFEVQFLFRLRNNFSNADEDRTGFQREVGSLIFTSCDSALKR